MRQTILSEKTTLRAGIHHEHATTVTDLHVAENLSRLSYEVFCSEDDESDLTIIDVNGKHSLEAVQ